MSTTENRLNNCPACAHHAFRQTSTWATNGRPGAHRTVTYDDGTVAHAACAHEIEYARAHFPSEAFLDGEMWVWASSNNPVPAEVLRNAGRPYAEVMRQEALKAEADLAAVRRIRDDHRTGRKPLRMSDEDLAEMRAAFGPGETVVNLITGERTTL